MVTAHFRSRCLNSEELRNAVFAITSLCCRTTDLSHALSAFLSSQLMFVTTTWASPVSFWCITAVHMSSRCGCRVVTGCYMSCLNQETNSATFGNPMLTCDKHRSSQICSFMYVCLTVQPCSIMLAHKIKYQCCVTYYPPELTQLGQQSPFIFYAACCLPPAPTSIPCP